MDHAVIPAPARFEAGDGQGFAVRPGTTVAYAGTAIAPLVGRFCAQVTRRTGLRLTPAPGDRVPDEPSVTIELAAANEPGGLPASAGLSPDGGDPAGERYSLVIEDGQVVLRAAEPVGVARGLTTLIQLMATSPSRSANEIRVPAAQITDAPRYAWRGLSLDVARTFFPVAEIRRVIDLLELYKLNVLHLHLTDDEAWPLALGRPAAGPEPGAPFYRDEDLRDLAGYAADRFVTIVPEIDTPGHTAALLRLRPDLRSGRNEVEYEFLPGHRRRAVWLDPELPATFELMEQVLAGVAAIFPGPYLHIGADEPRGMPDEDYVSYVRRLRRLVRILGRQPLGWQESARAGLGPDDVVQLLAHRRRPSGVGAAAGPGAGRGGGGPVAPRRRGGGGGVGTGDRLAAGPLLPRRPLRRPAGRRGHRCRAGGPARPPRPARLRAQDHRRLVPVGARRNARAGPCRAGRRRRSRDLGRNHLRLRRPVLPPAAPPARRRPPGLEHSRKRSGWAGHRDRLARHGRLWAQDGLTYFRASTVDWT